MLEGDTLIYQDEIRKLFNENLMLKGEISQLSAVNSENQRLKSELATWQMLALQAEDSGGDTE